MNVLSLFDGMSCGQLALNKAKIPYDNYFASELKPHAIAVTQKNYPKTQQLGDARLFDEDKLPPIDLLIGGSPCQDLSRANKIRDGLDGKKSSLFYVFIYMLEKLKPKNFLLENVIMTDENMKIFNQMTGVNPIRINSSLVSAQLRDRLYWTNIGDFDTDLFGNKTSCIAPPLDRNIALQDILTSGYTDRQKSRAILEGDSRPLRTPSKMWHRYYNTGFTTLVFDDPDLDWEKGIRYFNKTELERLQTVPEGYTDILSRNHSASLLGDGWTVDVIAHILSHMKG